MVSGAGAHRDQSLGRDARAIAAHRAGDRPGTGRNVG
jgi:hypothetical protein